MLVPVVAEGPRISGQGLGPEFRASRLEDQWLRVARLRCQGSARAHPKTEMTSKFAEPKSQRVKRTKTRSALIQLPMPERLKAPMGGGDWGAAAWGGGGKGWGGGGGKGQEGFGFVGISINSGYQT